MREGEALRADWSAHYLSFDGHGAVPANNAPMRLLQDAVKMRWPWQPRPDIVSRIRAEKPQVSTEHFLTGLHTLYPAYAEAALVATLGQPTTEQEATAYRAAYTMLMMAKEGIYTGEAIGVPRTTRFPGGTWHIGKATLASYVNGPAQQVAQKLLHATSLAFPPTTQRLWMRRYAFDSARTASFAEREESRSGVIGVYLTTFADTLLVNEAILEGGPMKGYKALHEHLETSRDKWAAGLDALQVSGTLYWDPIQDGPGCRMLTHWSIDEPLRTRNAPVEVLHRFTAHNLIELIRLTFERRQLPDFHAAARAWRNCT